jgi:poly(3-hydroxybutyrate) depolymerase
MLYRAYQAHNQLMQPAKAMARTSLAWLGAWRQPKMLPWLSAFAAGCELITRAELTHQRPSFGIDTVRVGNRDAVVTEETALELPFGTLLHFKKDVEAAQPKVLLVAPLSGHFATLLRNTVRTMLPDNDVYITDWHNARDVTLADGRFGFDDFVEYLIRFMETLGPRSHMVAVCQPCVQALVAVAAMAEENNPATPRSMTLMAGPVDTRISPTKVNNLASEHPIEWFENNLISTVPSGYAGAGRRVYPGFVQLTAFVSMNAERHMKAHRDLYQHLARGEEGEAEKIKQFYDEYFAVLDMPAEFYLETVQWVFQEARLATGELTFRGKPINLGAIRKTALLTVEGERDDICALGQTAAAHSLCTGLRAHKKQHYMQTGVGHYGVFSGRRWEGQVYPTVRNVITANN